MKEDPDLPIGLFDSGIGGLTVLREIVQLLPGESTLYLGDTARVPYGGRSKETVRRFSCQAGDYLARQGIKLLIVACNTATAMAIGPLRERFTIPVIGVVEPGARAAVSRTRSGTVGVIGTRATIQSGAYENAIQAIEPGLRVVGQACPLFVPLVEEGWLQHQVTEEIARIYLAPFRAMGVDTVVLGCTHYPLLRTLLQRVLGPEVTLVDSAREVARAVKEILDRGPRRSRSRDPVQRILVTDSAENFRRVARNFMGQLPEEIRQVRLI